MAKHPKRPRDRNQLAELIVDVSVGEVVDEPIPEETATSAARRRAAAREAKSRAKKLSSATREMIAIKAANARWKR